MLSCVMSAMSITKTLKIFLRYLSVSTLFDMTALWTMLRQQLKVAKKK